MLGPLSDGEVMEGTNYLCSVCLLTIVRIYAVA